jgi:uncharacterized membrane protein
MAVAYAFSEIRGSTDALAVLFIPGYSFIAAVGADALVKALQNRRGGSAA